MDNKFIPYMLIVVGLYSAVVTLMCLGGSRPADPVAAPTCQPVYVVSAGEFGLCNSVCQYRTHSGVKEVWRGVNASLNCVCESQTVSISGAALGKGL